MPSSTYQIDVLDVSCSGNESTCFGTDVSGSESLTTARWGDVDPGLLDVFDIALEVDKVRDLFGALPEPQAMIQPNAPVPQLGTTNVLDIVFTVDALKNLPYPFSGPCECPSTASCALGQLDECRRCQ